MNFDGDHDHVMEDQQWPQQPKISVIMAAYNAEPFIRSAIDSVLDQVWSNWELIVVNDGSQDGTSKILEDYKDPRIKVIHQSNRGVSRARNRAWNEASGEMIAFLDADDILPPRSLAARAELLIRDPNVMFADGAVTAFSSPGKYEILYKPSLKGNVFSALMRLSDKCFFGPSWMIRRTPMTDLRFPEHMSHAEDLALYLSIARAGSFDHTNEVVLHYRKGHVSAMSDLQGLDKGYVDLYRFARHLIPAPADQELNWLWGRIRSVMVRGYLKAGDPLAALKVFLRKKPQPSRE